MNALNVFREKGEESLGKNFRMEFHEDESDNEITSSNVIRPPNVMIDNREEREREIEKEKENKMRGREKIIDTETITMRLSKAKSSGSVAATTASPVILPATSGRVAMLTSFR